MNLETQILKLKRQLLVERAIFAAAAVILGLCWIHGRCADNKAFIMVDGKPVVCVSSERDAQQMLNEIKSGAGCDPGEIEFRQDVVVARAPRDARPVSRHKAMTSVRCAISPVVPRWAIIVDGKPVVAVASRTAAGEVLDMAKLRYGKLVKNLAEEPQFKQKVAVDMAAVNPSIYRKSPEAALAYLFQATPAQPRGAIHVVKSGDLAGKIASAHGMKLADLWAINPGANLNRLQIGDRVRVKRAAPPAARLTVVVRDQSERVESIPPPTRRVSSTRMFVGKSAELSPGSPGKRRVTVATIYENGRNVGSEILREEILRPPTPRRVAEGIKER